eukprot:1838183-Amphidinium_carterae.1
MSKRRSILPFVGFGMNLVSMLSLFGVGNLCVRCRQAVEDLEHIVHHCPAWCAERLGMLRDMRLGCRPTFWLLLLVLSCMVCCLLH